MERLGHSLGHEFAIVEVREGNERTGEQKVDRRVDERLRVVERGVRVGIDRLIDESRIERPERNENDTDG